VSAFQYTYTISESVPGQTLWTAPAAHIPVSSELPPSSTNSGVSIWIARNEFEIAQIVINSVAGAPALSFSVSTPAALGTGGSIAAYTVGFSSGIAELLSPLSTSAGSVATSSSSPTVIYIKVYASTSATPGLVTTNVNIGAAVVPLNIYIFQTTLPAQWNFKTQLDLNVAQFVPNGGATLTDVDTGKDILYDLKFTPTSVYGHPDIDMVLHGTLPSIQIDAHNSMTSLINHPSPQSPRLDLDIS